MRSLWLSLSLVIACSDETLVEEDSLPSFEPDTGGGNPRANGEELQGKSLLGNFADEFNPGGGFLYARTTGATVPNNSGGTIAVTVRVLGGKLEVKRLNGVIVPRDKWEGLRMETQGPGYLVLTSIDDSEPTRERYVLEYEPTAGAPPTAYCDIETGDSASAVTGAWSRQRERFANPNAISFGCKARGVADKCIMFGYDPDTMFDAYQACSQATNANYCWDGVSHTYDETPVLLADYVTASPKPDPDALPPMVQAPVSPWPPNPDAMYFEAAFAPRQPVLCLSAVRWESLRPGPGCSPPANLPDPRHEGSGGRFCEDYTYAELKGMGNGNTVFVASRAMDMSLHRWRHWNSGDLVTTARGYASNRVAPMTIAGEQVTLNTPPFGGYGDLREFDGFILRNLPGTLDASEMVPLYVHYKKVNDIIQDIVIAGAGSLPDHDRAEFEGYIFPDDSPNRVPFILYKRAGTTDYASGTRPPSTGWQTVITLGYTKGP